MQGQPEKVPPAAIKRVIRTQTKHKQWNQLGRTYDEIRNYKKAVINYCKGIIDSLEQGNTFSGAYYLKELSEKGLHVPLFKETYEKFEADKDIWWAFRSLQELEWWGEAENLLRRHEGAIQESGDHFLLKELYAVKGDVDAYRKLELREAATITHDSETGSVGFLGVNDEAEDGDDAVTKVNKRR